MARRSLRRRPKAPSSPGRPAATSSTIPASRTGTSVLFKKFAINERTGFQFRAEAFDAFNHPNLNGAGTNPNNLSTFGKVTGKTNDVRNLQLSLRFYF